MKTSSHTTESLAPDVTIEQRQSSLQSTPSSKTSAQESSNDTTANREDDLTDRAVTPELEVNLDQETSTFQVAENEVGKPEVDSQLVDNQEVKLVSVNSNPITHDSTSILSTRNQSNSSVGAVNVATTQTDQTAQVSLVKLVRQENATPSNNPAVSTKTITNPCTNQEIDYSIIDYDATSNHQRYLKQRLPYRKLLVLFLFLLAIIPGLENTSISPAIEQIQQTFNADIIALQTLYIAGMALGQFFWGPIIDKYGRKPILIFTALAGILANLYIVNASTSLEVFLCRFVQGFTFGGLALLPAIILKDIFSARNFIIYNSWILLFLLYAPALGPIIGGTIVELLSWRWIFNLISMVLTLLLVIYFFCIPETIETKNTAKLSLRQNLYNYYKILANKQAFYLILFNVGYSFCIFSLPLFIPALFLNHYDIEPGKLGWYFIFPVLVTLAGNRLNVHLVRKNYSPTFIWLQASFIQLLVTMLALIIATKYLNPYTIIMTISCALFFNGFQLGNIQSLYLSLYPEQTAVANALMSLLKLIIPALIANVTLHLMPQYGGLTLLYFDASVIVLCTALTLFYRFRYAVHIFKHIEKNNF